MYLTAYLPSLLVFVAFFFGLQAKIFLKSAKIKNFIIYLSVILIGLACFSSIFNFFIEDQFFCITSFIKIFEVDWGVNLNKISNLMVTMVTFISFMVHIFSMEYMKDDENKNSFFCFLSLFTFFMLILVVSNNFVQLFVGWEGVGLCSYLLIGFFYQKESANNAALKAFLVNRIADAGLIIAIAIIYHNFHSLNFQNVLQNLDILNKPANFLWFNWKIIDWVCIFLFIGCMGKSAQLIFHVWLPDAMEGPTPVSALIHAATMVTAGIFLMIICHQMFSLSTIAQNLVMLISGLTIIFAGFVAINQNDIKKIIAYSTCSQLGYMVAGCGVTLFEGSFFHLLTHAFFKAMLFLGAGSIIHLNAHIQDIRKLPGQLYRKMPLTMIFMLIGTLAITGFPPFSGFFSKDLIIEGIWLQTNSSLFAEFLFICAILGAFLTALYSWRLLFMVFFNDNEVVKNVNDGNYLLKFPLLILSIISVFSGIFAIYFLKIGSHESFLKFLTNAELINKLHEIPQIIQILPLLVGIFGFVISYLCFYKKMFPINEDNFFIQCCKRKFYFDEFYNKFLVSKIKILANFVSYTIEKYLGRGADAVLINNVQQISQRVDAIHNNNIIYYALFFILSLIVIILSLLLV